MRIGAAASTRRERTTTIISCWPKRGFAWRLPSGDYDMPPCPPCEQHQTAPCGICKPVATYVVHRRVESTDIGDDRHIIMPIDDLELANDLVSGSKQFGVLVCAEDEPTAEEIDEAYGNLERYLKMILEQEDAYWAATGKRFSGEHASMAARYFNVPRTWAQDTKPKQPCPACQTHNPIHAVKCSNTSCGAILNWDKAREYGVLTDQQVEYGLRTGKLEKLPGD